MKAAGGVSSHAQKLSSCVTVLSYWPSHQCSLHHHLPPGFCPCALFCLSSPGSTYSSPGQASTHNKSHGPNSTDKLVKHKDHKGTAGNTTYAHKQKLTTERPVNYPRTRVRVRRARARRVRRVRNVRR
jgi:hypothetical protein